MICNLTCDNRLLMMIPPKIRRTPLFFFFFVKNAVVFVIIEYEPGPPPPPVPRGLYHILIEVVSIKKPEFSWTNCGFPKKF